MKKRRNVILYNLGVLLLFFIGIWGLEVYSSYKITKDEYARIKEQRSIRLRDYAPYEKRIFTQFEEEHPYIQSLDTIHLIADQYGFIEPSIVHEDADLNIVFMGGSTTECLLVNPNSRFPYVAGRLIEEKTGKKINGINSGVSGNNIMHSLDLFLNKILPTRPDMVVLMHNANDLSMFINAGDYWNPKIVSKSLVYHFGDYQPEVMLRKQVQQEMGWMGKVLPALSERLYFGMRRLKKEPLPVLDYDEFGATRGEYDTVDTVRIMQNYIMGLRAFVRACKSWDVKPVLMTQVYNYDSSQLARPDTASNLDDIIQATGIKAKRSEELIEVMHSRFNSILRKVAIEEDAFLIDLAAKIQADESILYDEIHYTEEGSKAAARIISEELSSLLKE